MTSALKNIPRLLKMDLPPRQSAFLWGARKTGKSTYLKMTFPDSIRYDLLQSDLHLELLKEPRRLREQLQAMDEKQLRSPVIIDEFQKNPALLDEVHWLIENLGISFILCGSSARKLKKASVNLLGGRAWRYTFYPFVSREIRGFHLLKALNAGLIPSHYLSTQPKRSLKAYVSDYLTHEIQAEGLTRNLPAFSRFLDAVSFSQGELVNYANIARDCGVDAKTVREYFQILVDTMVGYLIPPFTKKMKRDIISATPKFYLFDVGLANHLSHSTLSSLAGSEAGRAFEHFILMELMAYRGIHNREFEIAFWRTKTGLEVDFILGNASVAIEIKIAERIDRIDLSGLAAFVDEHKPKNAYVVCREKRVRRITLSAGDFIHVVPYEHFLEKLWNHEVI